MSLRKRHPSNLWPRRLATILSEIEEVSREVLVKFSLFAPKVKCVHVAGTFNGWNIHEYDLQKDRRGVWHTQLSLPAGCAELNLEPGTPVVVLPAGKPVMVPVPPPSSSSFSPAIKTSVESVSEPGLPEHYGDNQIYSVARDPFALYVYWEIQPEFQKFKLKKLEASSDKADLIVRIYDQTDTFGKFKDVLFKREPKAFMSRFSPTAAIAWKSGCAVKTAVSLPLLFLKNLPCQSFFPLLY